MLNAKIACGSGRIGGVCPSQCEFYDAARVLLLPCRLTRRVLLTEELSAMQRDRQPQRLRVERAQQSSQPFDVGCHLVSRSGKQQSNSADDEKKSDRVKSGLPEVHHSQTFFQAESSGHVLLLRPLRAQSPLGNTLREVHRLRFPSRCLRSVYAP